MYWDAWYEVVWDKLYYESPCCVVARTLNPWTIIHETNIIHTQPLLTHYSLRGMLDSHDWRVTVYKEHPFLEKRSYCVTSLSHLFLSSAVAWSQNHSRYINTNDAVNATLCCRYYCSHIHRNGGYFRQISRRYVQQAHLTFVEQLNHEIKNL